MGLSGPFIVLGVAVFCVVVTSCSVSVHVLTSERLGVIRHRQCFNAVEFEMFLGPPQRELFDMSTSKMVRDCPFF